MKENNDVFKSMKWRVSLDEKNFFVEPFKRRKQCGISGVVCHVETEVKPDGDMEMVAVQEIVFRNMYTPAETHYSVAYESKSQEEDAKRFLIDTLLEYAEEAENKGCHVENIVNNLNELKKKLKKSEKWYRIELVDEKFTVIEYNHKTDEEVDKCKEGIRYHNFHGTQIIACCRKKNIEHWKKKMVKLAKEILSGKITQSKAYYDETRKDSEERIARLQKLMNKEN
ncbi:MAG: hypothetical protein IKQ34_04370 [Bacilli bacterium]|nr:hypothetical protein [Bacilli bacterium]